MSCGITMSLKACWNRIAVFKVGRGMSSRNSAELSVSTIMDFCPWEEVRTDEGRCLQAGRVHVQPLSGMHRPWHNKPLDVCSMVSQQYSVWPQVIRASERLKNDIGRVFHTFMHMTINPWILLGGHFGRDLVVLDGPGDLVINIPAYGNEAKTRWCRW